MPPVYLPAVILLCRINFKSPTPISQAKQLESWTLGELTHGRSLKGCSANRSEAERYSHVDLPRQPDAGGLQEERRRHRAVPAGVIHVIGEVLRADAERD